MEVINHVFMLWASQNDKYEHRAVMGLNKLGGNVINISRSLDYIGFLLVFLEN